VKEAYLYKKIKDHVIRCDLCAHRCVIEDGANGKCCVRANEKGVLYSLVYGKIIAENIDPIEKKPLYHFFPGTLSYSIATVGCNFKCFFCQNWQISQMTSDEGIIQGNYTEVDKVIENAKKNNCQSISYTYTEPTIFFEYAYDIAKKASKDNIKNVFVTNGFMTKECIEMIHPYLDAANIDLKSFKDEFYVRNAGARLKPVLESIKNMHERNIWIEITTLLIPGENDSPEELEDISGFIASISKDIPWHISAYFPQYKSKIDPTKIDSIIKAIEIGKKAGLNYIYGGNVAVKSINNTYCPNCSKEVIDRMGYQASQNFKGRCRYCDFEISGRFNR
jgi:pyruvate formate lyase activating enzyme